VAQLINEKLSIRRDRRNFAEGIRLPSESTTGILDTIELYGVNTMRYFLLTGIALLLLGSGAVQAQFFPNPYSSYRHRGYVPRYRPPVALNLSIVRPVAPVYVAPPIIQQTRYYPVPAVPVAPALPQLFPVPTQPLVPQANPQQVAQLVTGWYNQYLHRQPDAPGLQNHIQVVLTQGEDVALSGILGSDEYWQVCGQDVRSWITSLYVGVLNRQPAEAEIQHWYQVLVSLGGDRQKVVLNFLPAARLEPPR